MSDVGAPSIVRATSLERDPLKKQPKNFLFKCWKYLGLPKPTDLQYDMTDFLHSPMPFLLLMAFRGAAKSYTTVVDCLHALYCDPDELVLTVSATSDFAKTNAQFALMMILGFDFLQHMIPKTDQRRSALGFDVADARPKKFESFKSDSLFGQITGRRASLIVPDDVETPQTSDTEGKRQLLRARYAELGGAILLPGGRIHTLGTAQTEASLYTELATDKGYVMRMWPIVYPAKEELIHYGNWLAPRLANDLEVNPFLAGTSTEPTRFTEADIAQRQLQWGTTEFLRQFKLRLDAGQANESPLKLRDLLVLEWAPPKENEVLKLPPEVDWGPHPDRKADIPVDGRTGDALYYPSHVSPSDTWRPAEYVRCYVDPSGGGSDETTWTIEATLNGLAFICHQGASLEGYSDTVLEQIAADCKLWGAGYCKVESNFGQGMFGALLRPKLLAIHHPCTIEEDRKSVIQKERRIISTLEPAMTGHRVVVNIALLRQDYNVNYASVEDAKKRFYRLMYQLTRLTKQKDCLAHDDRVDGLASAIQELIAQLQQMTDEARKRDIEARMAEEIEHILAVRAKQGLPVLDTYGMPIANDNRRFGMRTVGYSNSRFHKITHKG